MVDEVQNGGTTAEGNGGTAVEEVTQVPGFNVVKLGDRFVRMPVAAGVPEGAEVIDLTQIEGMELDKMGELYGELAKTSVKKFKTKKVAIESINYQVGKLPIVDPASGKVTVNSPANDTKTNTAAPGEKKERAKKALANVELLTPPDAGEKLKKLAPQARELVMLMTEMATAKGSTSLTGDELSAALNTPEFVARLRTRQEPARIFSYYRPVLNKEGFIKL